MDSINYTSDFEDNPYNKKAWNIFRKHPIYEGKRLFISSNKKYFIEIDND